MDKTGIGIVGLGAIGQVHIKRFSELPTAEVVAVADLDVELLNRTGAEYGVDNKYTDASDLVDDPAVDAVVVCVPNYLHAEISKMALEHGKHVLCEKPMALNAAQAEDMVRAADDNDRTLMIAQCWRFKPQSLVLKDMIEQGVFGDIYHAQVVLQRRRGIPGLGGWFTTKEKSGGGPLIDIGVHVIDMTLHMMGYPNALRASAATYAKFGTAADYNYVSMWAEESSVKGGTFDVEDYATALVRLEGGKTLSLECSWAANLGDEQLFSLILGTDRGAKISGSGLEVYGEDAGYITDFKPKYKETDAYLNQARHFVEAVVGGHEPQASGREVLKLQKLIDTIYCSAREGKELPVSDL